MNRWLQAAWWWRQWFPPSATTGHQPNNQTGQLGIFQNVFPIIQSRLGQGNRGQQEAKHFSIWLSWEYKSRCVTIWNAWLRDKYVPAVNFCVKHQPLDVCLFPHHLRLSVRVRGCIFLHMTSSFFLHVGHIIVTLLNCIIESGRMRLRRAGRRERERDGKRKRLSSPDGGWIQSALAWGGRGSVQPSCEFAFRLQRAPASASSQCCTLSLQGCCFFLFVFFTTTTQIHHSSIWFSANRAWGWTCAILWTN